MQFVRNLIFFLWLGSILARSALAAEPAAAEPFHLYLPDKTWALDIDLQGFAIADNAISRDLASRDLTASQPDNGLSIAVSLSPAGNDTSAIALRDEAAARLRRLRLPVDELKRYEKDGRAYLECTLTEGTRGRRLTRRDVYVFFLHDGTVIEARASKVGATAADSASFERLFASLAINRTFQPSTPDVISIGALLLRWNKPAQAATWFQRAFDREKLRATLPPPQWLGLVDALGFAYSLAGERTKAREILRLGIAQHSDFPLFYYHLARTYGEENNLEEALKNLRLALFHRARLPAGAKLPDPAADDAFQPFFRDPRFQKIAEEYAHAAPPQAL